MAVSFGLAISVGASGAAVLSGIPGITSAGAFGVATTSGSTTGSSETANCKYVLSCPRELELEFELPAPFSTVRIALASLVYVLIELSVFSWVVVKPVVFSDASAAWICASVVVAVEIVTELGAVVVLVAGDVRALQPIRAPVAAIDPSKPTT